MTASARFPIAGLVLLLAACTTSGTQATSNPKTSSATPVGVVRTSPQPPSTPALETLLINVTTSLPPTGEEAAGAAFRETAKVVVSSGKSAMPTGTVTYSFFDNGACRGGAKSTQAVTLSGGSVPDSSSTGGLSAGTYSFSAAYAGDGNYSGSSSKCDVFSVHRYGPLTVATQLMNGATPLSLTGNAHAPASINETVTIEVTDMGNPIPVGTVTYRFFKNGTCDGAAASSQTVTITGGGVVPQSNPAFNLATGAYGFGVSYSGDINYPPSTSDCDGFWVDP